MLDKPVYFMIKVIPVWNASHYHPVVSLFNDAVHFETSEDTKTEELKI